MEGGGSRTITATVEVAVGSRKAGAHPRYRWTARWRCTHKRCERRGGGPLTSKSKVAVRSQSPPRGWLFAHEGWRSAHEAITTDRRATLPKRWTHGAYRLWPTRDPIGCPGGWIPTRQLSRGSCSPAE